MRRREAPPPTTTDVPPDELRAGACIQVWAGDGSHLLDAFRRHGDARNAWLNARNIGVGVGCEILPPGGPWSLDQPGADERLARHGLSRRDIPRLHEAAMSTPARR